MKIRLEELIIGFLLGIIISQTLLAFANYEYNIIPNPFKIKVNNIEKQIEGYNINGNSYFKLRDIGKQVGFEVDFKENTIMIDTNESTQNNNTGFYNRIMEKWNNYSYDVIIDYENEKYIELSALSMIGFTLEERLPIDIPVNNEYCWIIDQRTNKILSPEIKFYLIDKSGYIKFSDFEEHIKPHIDKILDEKGILKGSLN